MRRTRSGWRTRGGKTYRSYKAGKRAGRRAKKPPAARAATRRSHARKMRGKRR